MDGPAGAGGDADVAADFDARVRAGDEAFTERDRELLLAIDAAGSLNAAADDLDRSYAHAQRRVVELEAAFGSLVERNRGGEDGGGSTLTDRARELLGAIDRLSAEFAGVAEVTETVLGGRVVDRDGELATVDTAAGAVDAVAPPGVDTVEVGIRADTVTLNPLADAPGAGSTSARNRFEGTVAVINAGTSLARVDVDVAEAVRLSALLTRDSVDRLGLARGTPVVASFKATATRAVPSEPDSDAGS
jgi:molybdate transport system regulatory protein